MPRLLIAERLWYDSEVMKLTKTFRFESAHRLVKGYEGKCRHLHGHSWNGHIECEGHRFTAVDMIVDFKDLGAFIKQLEKTWDHATLVADSDEELIMFLEAQNSRYIRINGNPTCERIAMTIFDLAVAFFAHQPDITVSAVVIEETCTTSCRYEGEEILGARD